MMNTCPDCGAQGVDGRDGCQAVWNEMVYAQGGMPVSAFDAYCLQHLERYCLSAKSYAAHLTRLCCAMAYHSDPHLYNAIQTWLNGNRPLVKPPLLPFLGGMTIMDIYHAPLAERNRVRDAWQATVWAAYAPQHALAHAWIEQALAHQPMVRKSSPKP